MSRLSDQSNRGGPTFSGDSPLEAWLLMRWRSSWFALDKTSQLFCCWTLTSNPPRLPCFVPSVFARPYRGCSAPSYGISASEEGRGCGPSYGKRLTTFPPTSESRCTSPSTPALLL